MKKLYLIVLMFIYISVNAQCGDKHMTVASPYIIHYDNKTGFGLEGGLMPDENNFGLQVGVNFLIGKHITKTVGVNTYDEIDMDGNVYVKLLYRFIRIDYAFSAYITADLAVSLKDGILPASSIRLLHPMNNKGIFVDIGYSNTVFTKVGISFILK
jgi:hypothetical protein